MTPLDKLPSRPGFSLNLFGQLCALLGIFFTGALFTSGIVLALGLSSPAMSRNLLLLTAIVQDLLMFILPAWITAWLLTARPAYALAMYPVAGTYNKEGRNRKGKTALNYGGVFIVYLISLPAMNYIVEWNSNIKFPEFASGLEKLLRSLENQAAETTSTILGDPSVWGIISGILVIGLLAAISEEMFFRGGLQRILRQYCSVNAAVWITAIVFSFMHFQFYGFIPRLLIGLFLGYLLCWTGSLYPSIAAHALNNSMAVFAAWLIERGVASEKLMEIGATPDTQWLAIASLCATVLFFVFLRNFFFKNGRS